VTEHLPIDMPRNLHDCFVSRTALSQFSDQGVTVVMPAALNFCICAHGLPGCLERGHMPGRIRRHGFAPWEEIPFVMDSAKSLQVPDAMVDQRVEKL
jgi:hypothetical protein